MDSACEDGAKDNPKVGSCAKLGSHNSAENRSKSGYVEELDHENLPCWQWKEIDSIGVSKCRSLPGEVWCKNTFDERAIYDVATNK